MIDAYPRADGALFELAADYGGVGSVYVYALLPPSAAASAPSSSPVPATAPVMVRVAAVTLELTMSALLLVPTLRVMVPATAPLTVRFTPFRSNLPVLLTVRVVTV